jgi:hypothetical protein
VRLAGKYDDAGPARRESREHVDGEFSVLAPEIRPDHERVGSFAKLAEAREACLGLERRQSAERMIERRWNDGCVVRRRHEPTDIATRRFRHRHDAPRPGQAGKNAFLQMAPERRGRAVRGFTARAAGREEVVTRHEPRAVGARRDVRRVGVVADVDDVRPARGTRQLAGREDQLVHVAEPLPRADGAPRAGVEPRTRHGEPDVVPGARDAVAERPRVALHALLPVRQVVPDEQHLHPRSRTLPAAILVASHERLNKRAPCETHSSSAR